MGLTVLYDNRYSDAFITANTSDFDEFIRLSTLASQNIVNGIDPYEEEDKLYRMLILFDAIKNTEISDDDEETLRYCLTSIRVKTPVISSTFFTDEFFSTYCTSFNEFLRLMTEASQRQIEGKESKSRHSTAARILLILEALTSPSLSDDDIESLQYCLLNLNVTITNRSIGAITTPCDEQAQSYSMVAGLGLFSLTGISASFSLTFTIIAEMGSFSLTGEDLSVGLNFELIADVGTFSLSGQSTTLTLVPYDLEMSLVEAVAASCGWTARFEMDNSPFTQVDLTCLNNGSSDSDTLASGDTITCTVWKTTNGSVTQEAGYVEFFIDGVSQDLQSFITAATVDFASAKIFNFTGITSGSVLRVEVQEA